jgi:tetratricopeptide (TPR) repeat protein
MTIKIARGMAEAHRHGIVHRDLKPGNILLDRQGEPVVTDFGLAMRADVSEATVDPDATLDPNPRLTQAGALMGTPSYMPPEQARGDLDKIGPASDVYSLGAIFFQLVTGRTPFIADSVPSLLEKIKVEPAPLPSQVKPGVSPKVDAICCKALAKDPAERFPSMEAFADALLPLATSGGNPWRVRMAIAAAAFFLAIVAGVIFYVKTDHGTVEVRLSDTSADVQVTVDGDEIQVNDKGRVTRLRTGPHALQVSGPNYQTETKLFKVTRGQTTLVEIELKPKTVVAEVPKNSPFVVPAKLERLAALLRTGSEFIERGLFMEVGRVADESLVIDPESPTALAYRATFRYGKRDAEGARADVTAALKLNPNTFQALIVRGLLNIDDGVLLSKPEMVDEAIADNTEAIRIRPSAMIPWANRGYAYLLRGEFHQAIADSTEAIRLGDKRPNAWQTRGGAYAILGDYPKSLADYQNAAQVDPSLAKIQLQLSAVYAKMKDFAKSTEHWNLARKLDSTINDSHRIVFDDPPKPIERKKLTPEQAKDLEQALARFEQAWSKKDLKACEQAAEDACRIDLTCAGARSARARIWAPQGRLKEAIAEATEAIRLDPNDAWAYSIRGYARNESKNHAGAIADQTIALRLDPKKTNTWNDRGFAYLQRGQRLQAIADFNEALRLNPNFDLALANRGRCYLELGETQKALDDHERLAAMKPASALLRLLIAAIRARLGDFQGAQKDRETAIAMDANLKDAPEITLPPPLPAIKRDPEPADPKATVTPAVNRDRLAQLLAQGRKLINNERYDTLGAIADEALKIDLESPTALAYRATFRLVVQADRAGALTDAEAALKLNPETHQAFTVRSVLRGFEGNVDGAIADLTIVTRLNSAHPGPYSNRAHAYFLKKEYRQAVADATKAIELGFRGPSPWGTRGSCHVYLGEYEKALADHDQFIKLQPGDPQVFVQRSAIHAKLGNVVKSAADWDMAKKLNPRLTEDDRLPIPPPPKPPERKKLTPAEVDAFATAINEAQTALPQFRIEDCRKATAEALRIDPTSALAHSIQARLHATTGQFEQARMEADEAIRLDPNDAWAYVVRGGCKANRKDLMGAIADYCIAIRLDPNNSSAWSNRGDDYLRLGQVHQALSDANKAIRLRPDLGQAFANRGACFMRFGEYDKALAEYVKAAEFQPKSAQMRRICATLFAKLGRNEESKKYRDAAIAIDPRYKDAKDMTIPAPLPPLKIDP